MVKKGNGLHNGREAVDEGEPGDVDGAMTRPWPNVSGASWANGAHGRCRRFPGVLRTRSGEVEEGSGRRVVEVSVAAAKMRKSRIKWARAFMGAGLRQALHRSSSQHNNAQHKKAKSWAVGCSYETL